MPFMTKIAGTPDRSEAVPGMAFFAGTGPRGAKCGGCKHLGYWRESSRGSWDEKSGNMVHKTYRVQKCEMYRKMTGRHGADIGVGNSACKYFEPAIVSR